MKTNAQAISNRDSNRLPLARLVHPERSQGAVHASRLEPASSISFASCTSFASGFPLPYYGTNGGAPHGN